jgi:hypothetical protein
VLPKEAAEPDVEHYDITEWTDFARGLGSPNLRTAMQQHLTSGCQKCQQTHDLLTKLVAVTAREAAYDVPDYAVRLVKAVFALQRPEKVTLPRILAKLVYDSFLQPQPAGVRGEQQHITRQAMYWAGDYAVDVRIERERDASQIVMVGQVSDRNNPDRHLARIPVVLMSENHVLAHAVSNEFGEFVLKYEPGRKLRLHLPLPENGAQIEVQLNGLAEQNGKD